MTWQKKSFLKLYFSPFLGRNFSQAKKDNFDFATIIILNFILEFDFGYLDPGKNSPHLSNGNI